MDYKMLRPSQVRLDPRNPRLPDGSDNDHEAINRLLDESYPGLLALAKDLTEVGESNPTELPIVVKEGSKYLVLEGNRRFAALKLLANPSLADDPAQQAAFERVARKGTPPNKVMCAVDASRESADHWLVLRHTGQNRGVGVRPWSAEQVATHRRRARATVDSGTARSITIADELEEAYARDLDLVTAIRRVRAAKLTNIGRFFSSELMDRIHFTVRDTSELYARSETLWAKHSASELHPFISWAISYIDTNSVDHYKNGQIRNKLLDDHRHLLPDTRDIDRRDFTRLADSGWFPSDKDGESDGQWNESRTFNDGEGGTPGSEEGSGEPGNRDAGSLPGGSSNGAANQPKARRKNEAAQERRLFQDLKLPHLSRRTQLLLKEARQIEHEAAPGTACVMARVLVELAVSEPDVLAWSGAEEKDFFKEKVEACLKVLDPKYDKARPDDPRLNLVYLEIQDNFGVRYMHQFVHNPQAQPDAGTSRRFSSHWRPLLEAIDTKTGLERS